MLPKDLQGVQLHPPSSQLIHVAALAREMEHEHHELAFDTARVQEVTVGALDWMLWAEVAITAPRRARRESPEPHRARMCSTSILHPPPAGCQPPSPQGSAVGEAAAVDGSVGGAAQ